MKRKIVEFDFKLQVVPFAAEGTPMCGRALLALKKQKGEAK